MQQWNSALLKEFLGALRSMHAVIIFLKDEIVDHYVVNNRKGIVLKKLLISCRNYTSMYLFHKSNSWRRKPSQDHDASTPTLALVSIQFFGLSTSKSSNCRVRKGWIIFVQKNHFSPGHSIHYLALKILFSFFFLNLLQNKRFWFLETFQAYSAEVASYRCTGSL